MHLLILLGVGVGLNGEQVFMVGGGLSSIVMISGFLFLLHLLTHMRMQDKFSVNVKL